MEQHVTHGTTAKRTDGIKKLILLFDPLRYIPKKHSMPNEPIRHPYCGECGAEMIEKAIIDHKDKPDRYTGKTTEWHRRIYVCSQGYLKNWSAGTDRKLIKMKHDYQPYGPLIEVIQ